MIFFSYNIVILCCLMICVFQAELGKPSPSQPDKGKVNIYVDCSPTAAPMFEVAHFDSSWSLF